MRMRTREWGGATRRQVVAGLGALAVAAALPRGTAAAEAGPGVPFAADTVPGLARDLAARPFAPPPEIAPEWQALDYDTFRNIWFDGRFALFRGTGSPVQAEPFIAGRQFRHRIALHTVEDGIARPASFDPAAFARTDRFPALDMAGTGHAGLRLTGDLDGTGAFREYAVFLGASYFRAIGRAHAWGLSARGLAIGSGDPGEEFPLFRAFWIEKAAPGQPAVLHALMDGESLSGAFRFQIAPGDATVMEVEARLYPRRDIANAGVAPLTSMFLFNGMNRAGYDDHRPAVHDSDGLSVLNGAGEWLWRPLANPAAPGFTVLADRGPRGFGLMQRRRAAGAFRDLEAAYERRPSAWVEPSGDWGPGAVVLVELPTPDETHDNIVAFWRPEAPLRAGAEHVFRYRLTWADAAPAAGAVAPVIESRSGRRVFEPGRLYEIDWAAHPALGADPAAVAARVTATAGRVTTTVLKANPVTGGLTLALTHVADGTPAELRAELWRAGQRAGEVWLWRAAGGAA